MSENDLAGIVVPAVLLLCFGSLAYQVIKGVLGTRRARKNWREWDAHEMRMRARRSDIYRYECTLPQHDQHIIAWRNERFMQRMRRQLGA
jgi:hypothetical protein